MDRHCQPHNLADLDGGGHYSYIAEDWVEWRDEFNAENKKQKAGFVNVQWQELNEAAMRFIYSGHSDLARKILDEVTPRENLPEKGLENLCLALKTSPYQWDPEPTLEGLPRACANAKPRR